MYSEKINNALNRLQAHDATTMTAGLEMIELELANVPDEQLADLISAISAVFYLDVYEYPQFQAVVERAVATIASQGERVVPHLLSMLGDSDFKVEFNYALAFGKIGAPAVQPLLDAFEERQDYKEQSFIIYSLGKIRSSEVKSALPMLLKALESDSKDLRDSAARTLGKIAENVPSSEVPESMRSQIFDKLISALHDVHSGVRSKSCRSLGKLVKYGYLSERQRNTLQASIAQILGHTDYNWDNAFVVRREATEVEQILKK